MHVGRSRAHIGKGLESSHRKLGRVIVCVRRQVLHAAREVLCGVLSLTPPVESVPLKFGWGALRPRRTSRARARPLYRTVLTNSPGTRVAPTTG